MVVISWITDGHSQAGYNSEIIGAVAITFARLSIILFYQRIFQGPKFRRVAWMMGIVSVLFGVICALLFAFQCAPIDAFWTSGPNFQQYCLNGSFNVANVMLSILLDVAILAMPWPMIWKLQLKLKQKLGVLSIFMLGGV